MGVKHAQMHLPVAGGELTHSIASDPEGYQKEIRDGFEILASLT
jgi:hypothetical protein